MRLIDADEFLVYANKHVHELNCSDEAKRELIEIWLDEQPTAYDVDKVVERLETDEKHTFDGCINKRYAIEIVKSGLNAGTED